MKRESSCYIVWLIVLSLSFLIVPVDFSAETQPEEMSISLEKCVELALQNNLDIQASKIDPEISRLNYEIAKTLFDPVVSASASRSTQNSQAVSFISITRRQTDIYSLSVAGRIFTGGNYSFSTGTTKTDLAASFPIGINPSYSSDVSLNLGQPLLRNFGREVTRYSIIVSKNNYEVSNAVFRQFVITTVAQVEQGYWLLVGARDSLNVAKESLKLAQDQLGQNKIMLKVGTLAPLDVTVAEASVAQRVFDVVNAENILKLAEDNLRAILNITPDSPMWLASIIPTDRPSFEVVTVDLNESIKEAFEKRPELQEAAINLKTLELTMRYQKNQRLPQLDLNANYGLSGTAQQFSSSYSEVWDRNFTGWSLGLNFSIPIMNRAAAKEYVISKLNYDKANLSYRSLEEQVAIDVKNAARSVEMNIKKIDAAKAARILSKERLNAIQKKFDNGMATNLEVFDYQQQLASAESNEIQALIAYNVALMSLERAKGNLLESRGIMLESSGK